MAIIASHTRGHTYITGCRRKDHRKCREAFAAVLAAIPQFQAAGLFVNWTRRRVDVRVRQPSEHRIMTGVLKQAHPMF